MALFDPKAPKNKIPNKHFWQKIPFWFKPESMQNQLIQNFMTFGLNVQNAEIN